MKFPLFSSVNSGKFSDSNSVISRLLPAPSFPINHEKFNATQSEILPASFNKLKMRNKKLNEGINMAHTAIPIQYVTHDPYNGAKEKVPTISPISQCPLVSILSHVHFHVSQFIHYFTATDNCVTNFAGGKCSGLLGIYQSGAGNL